MRIRINTWANIFASNLFLDIQTPRLKKSMRLLLSVLMILSTTAAADDGWPGSPPDCWSEARLFHSGEKPELWQKHLQIKRIKTEKPGNGVMSPNKAYFYTLVDERPNATITIYSEKDQYTQLSITKLHGISEIKWISEKLIFMRLWWGRVAATDIIFDVEKEKVIYSERIRDGAIAFQQFKESCPVHGCTCINKNQSD